MRTDDGRRRAERFGTGAEALCVLALRLKGYRVLGRRVRTPVGEIDIVARRGRVLAFVEVKARPDLGAALDALRPRQRERVERAARLFLARHPALLVAGTDLRFDLMLVRPRRWPHHVRNAWMPEPEALARSGW